MSEWIKFHAELTKGAKRGLPRSVRFVYLELSLLARPGSGSIDLATGMTDCAAVSDMLGGNSREVREAVALLSAGDDPMIRFEGPKDRRRLIIVAWERWNERPGRSTERVQRHRNAHVTRYTPVTNGDETAAERSGNAPRGEKRREEKIPPYKSPPHGVDDSPSDSTTEQTQAETTESTPATHREVFAAYVEGWRRRVGRGVEPTLTEARVRKLRARLREHDLETLKRAAAGIWLSEWHVANGQTSFDLVVRDAGHVERFAADYAKAHPATAAVEPLTPPPMPAWAVRPDVVPTPAPKTGQLAALAAMIGNLEAGARQGVDGRPDVPTQGARAKDAPESKPGGLASISEGQS